MLVEGLVAAQTSITARLEIHNPAFTTVEMRYESPGPLNLDSTLAVAVAHGRLNLPIQYPALEQEYQWGGCDRV